MRSISRPGRWIVGVSAVLLMVTGAVVLLMATGAVVPRAAAVNASDSDDKAGQATSDGAEHPSSAELAAAAQSDDAEAQSSPGPFTLEQGQSTGGFRVKFKNVGTKISGKRRRATILRTKPPAPTLRWMTAMGFGRGRLAHGSAASPSAQPWASVSTSTGCSTATLASAKKTV